MFAHSNANWWEGGQKVKPGEAFQPRKLNTPLDKLARKHAGRRSLTKTERKHGRYIKSRPAGDKLNDIAFDATFRAANEIRVATLAIGYADGYRRGFGNRASVLVRGRRVPVVGVVTMDMTMIDVSDVPCDIGDVATLVGDDGDDRIEVADLAAMGGLSPYEVLTGLRGRLPRRYLESEV